MSKEDPLAVVKNWRRANPKVFRYPLEIKKLAVEAIQSGTDMREVSIAIKADKSTLKLWCKRHGHEVEKQRILVAEVTPFKRNDKSLNQSSACSSTRIMLPSGLELSVPTSDVQELLHKLIDL